MEKIIKYDFELITPIIVQDWKKDKSIMTIDELLDYRSRCSKTIESTPLIEGFSREELISFAKHEIKGVDFILDNLTNKQNAKN